MIKRMRLAPFPSWHARRLALAFLLVALILPATVYSDSVAERRATAGIRLFRALLAADLDLPKKTIAENQLLIVFFYVDDRSHAADLAARFLHESKDGERIRTMPVTVELSNDPLFNLYEKRAPSGIFITEAPGRNPLRNIVRFGIQHHRIVYSPFEGHVESGVLGGLSVEAQVRPYVNRSTIEASQISLRSFFMEVAKVY